MLMPLERVQSLIVDYEKLETEIELYLKEKELWYDFLDWRDFRKDGE